MSLVLPASERLFQVPLVVVARHLPTSCGGELWICGKHPGVSQEVVGMETPAFCGSVRISRGSSVLVNSGSRSAGDCGH